MEINRNKFSHENMTKVLNGVVDNWIGFYEERNERQVEWMGPDGKIRIYAPDGRVVHRDQEVALEPKHVPLNLRTLEKV